MSLAHFTRIDTEPYYKTWLHENGLVYIRQVPATLTTQMHYRPYKATVPVPKGRMPWTVKNTRIGHEKGFKTLEEAALAGDQA